MSVSDNPLRLFAPLKGCVPVSRACLFNGKRIKIAGFVAASRKVHTKNGEYMKFVSLMDKSGIIECVLFPKEYRKFGRVIRGQEFLSATGIVENDFDKVTLTVEKIEVLSSVKKCA
jgi:DNA polymerase III alpha subunit